MQSRLREVVRWAPRSSRTEMACDFPGITESPCLCRVCLEVGSTGISARLGAVTFFSMTGTDSATEHLKVPVPRALRTRVAAKLSNMYLQKKLNEEKLNEGLRK